MPEYLKTAEDTKALNLMDYGVPLGRRFRALKLWFVLRYYGREGIVHVLEKINIDHQERQRAHITLRPRELRAQHRLELPSIVQPGQRVERSKRLEIGGPLLQPPPIRNRQRQPSMQQQTEDGATGNDVHQFWNKQ